MASAQLRLRNDSGQLRMQPSQQQQPSRNKPHVRVTGLHQPLTLLSNTASPKQWIAQEMLAKLTAFSQVKPRAVGPMSGELLRLPLNDRKGTVLTWEVVLARTVEDIVNTPSGREACWLVRPVRASYPINGYHIFRVGNQHHYRTHRVLHAIYHPEFYESVAQRSGPPYTRHLCHACSHGYDNGVGEGLICISPHHCAYHDQLVNTDHIRCVYGCKQTCPPEHGGFCVWTWPDTGELKKCFNQPLLPAVCTCARKCSHTGRLSQPVSSDEEGEDMEESATTDSSSSARQEGQDSRSDVIDLSMMSSDEEEEFM